jgi:D-alanine transaminase
MDDMLVTHHECEKILSGISRKTILKLARENGIPVREEPLPVAMLGNITEAFVTNTSFEIAPVISIDGKPVGNGAPGPISKLLREKFDAAIRSLRP